MQIFLRNTETSENLTIAYLSVVLDWKSGDNRYISADIPQSNIGNQPQYWQGGSNAQRSIAFTLEGDQAAAEFDRLQSWAKKVSGKNAPPVCILQVGALEPQWCVISSVGAEMPLDRFRGEKPTRISVTLSYLVVRESAAV